MWAQKVLIRFFCFAPLPMLHRCRCVVLLIVSRSVTPNFSHYGNIALFRLGLSALRVIVEQPFFCIYYVLKNTLTIYHFTFVAI